MNKSDVQRFCRGDLVSVRADGFHRMEDVEVIVLGSYRDLYGGSCVSDYSVVQRMVGEWAWATESSMTFLRHVGEDGIKDVRAELAADRAKKEDLDWIFAHGADVASGEHSHSVQALASSMGLGSLWGARGEGIDYYTNAWRVIGFAHKFLLSGDKAGFLAAAEKFKIDR